MTTDSGKVEPFLQHYGWTVFAFLSVVFMGFGIGDMILGMDADPAIGESITGIPWEELRASSPEIANLIDMQVRATGAAIFFLSILSLSITINAFRPGQRWAWYTLWIWPLWNAGVFLVFFLAERQPAFPPPPPMQSAPILFVIALAGLVLTYRKFFPKA